MSTECPRCGSRYLRPARTRNFSEWIGQLRFISPLRCLDCNKRFIGKTLVWDDLSFARCPVCLRMDLNGWTGKTYDPPLWMKIKIVLGARRWRCEYCRLNFTSFRDRKEVFTFKRWKKFGHSAEEPGAANTKLEPVPPEGAAGTPEPGLQP
jgi:DNA-directed RNA polymerase subunit RPC12/RpoP